MLKSIPFESQQEIKSTISRLSPLASKALLFERKTDYEGRFLFHLKNADRTLIGESGVFESEAGMENGIKHLKKRITELSSYFSAL